MYPLRLDAVDRALIRGLRADGRVSYTDLGRQVGLSAPAVRDRVQRLIEAGILQIAAIPGVREVESFPYFGIHVHRFTWDVPD